VHDCYIGFTGAAPHNDAIGPYGFLLQMKLFLSLTHNAQLLFFCAIQYVITNANKNLPRNISFKLVYVDGYSLYETRPIYASYHVLQEVRLWIQASWM